MGFMDHISRANVNNNNAEILNSFNWDIKIVNWAKGVYYPGFEIFRNRLLTVSGLPEFTHSVVEYSDLAGHFKNIQPGDVDHEGASVTLEFQDYADSTIGYMLTDYMNKIEDPNTRKSLPKELLVVDFDVYQLNALRLPVKVFKLRTGLLANLNTNENFSNRHEAGGKVTSTWTFEYWTVEYLNTVPVTNS